MSFEKIKITNKGRQLLAKAAAGTTLTFTRIKMGDGQISSQVIETMTDVISEKVSLRLNEPTIGNGYTTISGNFRNAAAQDEFTGDGVKTSFTLSAAPTTIETLKINGTIATGYTYSNGIITFDVAPAVGDKIQATYNLDGFYWREVAVFAEDPDEEEILFAYQNAYSLAEYIAAASSEIIEKVIATCFTFSSEINVEIKANESLVLMPLAQGQYKTELLIEATEIEEEDFIPIYDRSAEENVKVTVEMLKKHIEKALNEQFAGKPQENGIILEASRWNAESKTYSYEEEYPSDTYDIVVELNGGKANDEQTEAWDAANVKGNWPENILYAKGDVPIVDIPIIRQVTKK